MLNHPKHLVSGTGMKTVLFHRRSLNIFKPFLWCFQSKLFHAWFEKALCIFVPCFLLVVVLLLLLVLVLVASVRVQTLTFPG